MVLGNSQSFLILTGVSCCSIGHPVGLGINDDGADRLSLIDQIRIEKNHISQAKPHRGHINRLHASLLGGQRKSAICL